MSVTDHDAAINHRVAHRSPGFAQDQRAANIVERLKGRRICVEDSEVGRSSDLDATELIFSPHDEVTAVPHRRENFRTSGPGGVIAPVSA